MNPSRTIPKLALQNNYTCSKYLSRSYKLVTKEKVKSKVILFQQDIHQMRPASVNLVMKKIEVNCCCRTGRLLWVLVKILLLKTFEMSQIIYLIQSINLEGRDFKRFNSTLHKFKLKRHFDAAKVPEIIVIHLIKTPVRLGDLDM